VFADLAQVMLWQIYHNSQIDVRAQSLPLGSRPPPGACGSSRSIHHGLTEPSPSLRSRTF